MDDADGRRTDTNDDPTTWADLFDRGARYGVDESAVREALARRRERVDE